MIDDLLENDYDADLTDYEDEGADDVDWLHRQMKQLAVELNDAGEALDGILAEHAKSSPDVLRQAAKKIELYAENIFSDANEVMFSEYVSDIFNVGLEFYERAKGVLEQANILLEMDLVVMPPRKVESAIRKTISGADSLIHQYDVEARDAGWLDYSLYRKHEKTKRINL